MSEFRMVPKEALKIDLNYQRDGSEAFIKNLARNWKSDSCGVLLVSQRENGELYIMDGGQRWRAMLLRPDITLAPCEVFQGKTFEEEAAVYLASKTRKAPTAIENHKTLLALKDPVAQGIEEVVASFGYRIASVHSKKDTLSENKGIFAAVSSATQVWKMMGGQKGLRRAFAAAQEIAQGDHFSGDLLITLAIINSHFPDFDLIKDGYFARLRNRPGHLGVNQIIAGVHRGTTGNYRNMAAMELVEMMNYGRIYRLDWETKILKKGK